MGGAAIFIGGRRDIMSNNGRDTELLSGQVAIVTGGASGIGRAVCRALADAGAAVVVADLKPGPCNAVVNELRAGRHLAVPTDVSDESAVVELVHETLNRLDRIDCLVASAGVLRGPNSSPTPLASVSTKEWDFVMAVNLRGMFLTNREVMKAMIPNRKGNIVNISSVSGLRGCANDAPYCASKFGVMGMTESLAQEARRYGIRVQVIAPDAVNTPIWDQNGPVPMPADALPPERVADLVLRMLTLPPDTVLGLTVIAPFKTRKRSKKKIDSTSGPKFGETL